MKMTRHNGKSGKHGTYNPKHNDRRFDIANSDHIDQERAKQNVYWDLPRTCVHPSLRCHVLAPDIFGAQPLDQ